MSLWMVSEVNYWVMMIYRGDGQLEHGLYKCLEFRILFLSNHRPILVLFPRRRFKLIFGLHEPEIVVFPLGSKGKNFACISSIGLFCWDRSKVLCTTLSLKRDSVDAIASLTLSLQFPEMWKCISGMFFYANGDLVNQIPVTRSPSCWLTLCRSPTPRTLNPWTADLGVSLCTPRSNKNTSYQPWNNRRVPTRPGKPGKMRVHLENLEISWNFEKI